MLPSVSKFIHTVYLFGKVPIQPFGVLVGLAIVYGYILARRRAVKVGLDPDLCADGMVWILISGFTVAHLVSVIFYFPERVVGGVFSLYAFWAGLSSFGGLFGAAIAVYLFFAKKWGPVVKYLDPFVFGLIPAVIFHLVEFKGVPALIVYVTIMVLSFFIFQKTGFSPCGYLSKNVLPWLFKAPSESSRASRSGRDRWQGAEVMKYVDTIIFGFVPAWVGGRMGCTVVFDHPGIRLNNPRVPVPSVVEMASRVARVWRRTRIKGRGGNWLVSWGPKWSYSLIPGWSKTAAWYEVLTVMLLTHGKDGVLKHNLGLYEMLLAVGLTLILYSVRNLRPYDGFYPSLILVFYSPVRFFLDILRIEDKTYLGFTPGQFFALVMVGMAAVLTVRGLRKKKRLAAATEDGASAPAGEEASKEPAPASDKPDKPASSKAARKKKKKKKK